MTSSFLEAFKSINPVPLVKYTNSSLYACRHFFFYISLFNWVMEGHRDLVVSDANTYRSTEGNEIHRFEKRGVGGWVVGVLPRPMYFYLNGRRDGGGVGGRERLFEIPFCTMNRSGGGRQEEGCTHTCMVVWNEL